MDPTVSFAQLAPLDIGGVSILPAIWITAVVALASFAAASLAILLIGHRLRRAALLENPLPPLVGDECIMVFLDKKLWFATERAEEFIDQLPAGATTWLRLADGLVAENGDIAALMSDLDTTGTAFSASV